MRGCSFFWHFSARYLQSFFRIPVRFFLLKYLKVKTYNIQHLEHLVDGAIIAANHTSKLDPIFLVAFLPKKLLPLYFVSRRKGLYKGNFLERIFFGGVFFKMFGAYATHSGQKDYFVSLREHIRLLKNKKTVCIFPSGGIQHQEKKGGGAHNNTSNTSARGGVIFLSEKTNKPIVPIYMEGLYGLSIKKIFFNRPSIVITYGKPLFKKDFGKHVLRTTKGMGAPVQQEKYKKYASLLMHKISQLKRG